MLLSSLRRAAARAAVPRRAARAGFAGMRPVGRAFAAPSDDGGASTTHFGFNEIPKEDKKAKVRELFDKVSDKYDVMNDLMSGLQHHRWKRHFVSTLGPTPSMRILDVAGGTGDITFEMLRFMREESGYGTVSDPAQGGGVVVCDLSSGMLDVGRRRSEKVDGASSVQWVEGNAEELPFADASMDAYTISFGIRNCTNVDKVVREAHRVLKPGGRFMCLEFSEVVLPVLRELYEQYSFQLIPIIGQVVANDRDSYQYLVESIRRFPSQQKFKEIIEDAGFQAVAYENLTGGIVAIHSGFKDPQVDLSSAPADEVDATAQTFDRSA